MDLVRSKSGVAVAGDFDSGRGTPVVVDTATGICYVVKADGTIVEIGSLLSSLVVSGRISSSVSDNNIAALFSGQSKGVRAFATSSGILLEGVDNTGLASYQPLYIGGSTLNWLISGVAKGGVDASGNQTCVGLLDISGASAGQIKFPATQNASTNANTLDDYEEGTWTPVDSSGASLTFTAAAGSYTKIGRLCIAQCTVIYPATASGLAAIIGGLPFTLGTSNGGGGALYNTGATAGIALAAASTTLVAIVKDPGAGVGVTNAQLSTFTIAFAVLYEVA